MLELILAKPYSYDFDIFFIFEGVFSLPLPSLIIYLKFNKLELAGWILWKGIVTRFIPIGICLVAVMQWRSYRKSTRENVLAKQWEVKFYCSLPLRHVSRTWGWIAGEFSSSLPFKMTFSTGLFSSR